MKNNFYLWIMSCLVVETERIDILRAESEFGDLLEPGIDLTFELGGIALRTRLVVGPRAGHVLSDTESVWPYKTSMKVNQSSIGQQLQSYQLCDEGRDLIYIDQPIAGQLLPVHDPKPNVFIIIIIITVGWYWDASSLPKMLSWLSKNSIAIYSF